MKPTKEPREKKWKMKAVIIGDYIVPKVDGKTKFSGEIGTMRGCRFIEDGCMRRKPNVQRAK